MLLITKTEQQDKGINHERTNHQPVITDFYPLSGTGFMIDPKGS